jgi:hypothetical protein
LGQNALFLAKINAFLKNLPTAGSKNIRAGRLCFRCKATLAWSCTPLHRNLPKTLAWEGE